MCLCSKAWMMSEQSPDSTCPVSYLWCGHWTAPLPTLPLIAAAELVSARIVFFCSYCVDIFSSFFGGETLMWRLCDRNERGDCEHKERSDFHCASDLSQFMSVLMKHYLQYFWGLIKTGRLWLGKHCSSATTHQHYTESGFDVKSYFYSAVLTLAWFYRINGGMSELRSTHDKSGDMDYTRVTKSKGHVDSRNLGSSAMHQNA